MRSTELAPKKEGNYNVVATWPCHMISLVIISNNIPLSLPIALTYCLVSDSSLFRYTKPHSSIIRNWPFYIALLRSPPAAIPFVEKRFLRHPYRHPIIFPFVGKQSSLIWFRWGFRYPLIALQLLADDLVIIQINLSQVSSFTQSLRPLEPPYGWWEYGSLDATSMAPWCSIALVAAMQ